MLPPVMYFYAVDWCHGLTRCAVVFACCCTCLNSVSVCLCLALLCSPIGCHWRIIKIYYNLQQLGDVLFTCLFAYLTSQVNSKCCLLNISSSIAAI